MILSVLELINSKKHMYMIHIRLTGTFDVWCFVLYILCCMFVLIQFRIRFNFNSRSISIMIQFNSINCTYNFVIHSQQQRYRFKYLPLYLNRFWTIGHGLSSLFKLVKNPTATQCSSYFLKFVIIFKYFFWQTQRKYRI